MAEVNRREIYRYLGIKGQQEPDPQTKDLVEDCLGELERSVNCRSFYRRCCQIQNLILRVLK